MPARENAYMKYGLSMFYSGVMVVTDNACQGCVIKIFLLLELLHLMFRRNELSDKTSVCVHYVTLIKNAHNI